jgi:hypothetical protein
VATYSAAECPLCGAKPGHDCTTASGRKASLIHSSRRDVEGASPPPPSSSTPDHLPLRAALEADLKALELTDHRALVELARVLADDLDREPAACFECGGHAGPSPQVALRYADALEALGIGSIPRQDEGDPFTLMVTGWGNGSPRR